MSLPIHFDNAKSYFEYALSFFGSHQHLFKFMNTDVLVLGIIQHIDLFNIETVDIFRETFQLEDLRRNDAVKVFLDECAKLSANVDAFVKVDDLEKDIDAPLGPKKKHEIAYLAEQIDLICKETNCSTVVDFGSGLGYLDQEIYKKSNLQVLGLECDKHRCGVSKSRQMKYHKNSKQNVHFRTHTISEMSDTFITKCLKQSFHFPGNICLTGLHACADLTITAMKLFIKMADVKSLVIMPCCYHKMNINLMDSEQTVFHNFPLSVTLKSVLNKTKKNFLGIPFLRLATQPPSTGENLSDLVFNLLARNVVQMYAIKYGLKVKRKKRKTMKCFAKEHNIDTYLQNIDEKFYLLCNDKIPENDHCDCNHQFNTEEISHMWRNECDRILLKKAAIFVLKQRRLQAVFENFILFDRLVFLHENGFEKSCFRKIFDESISPKCFALVITK